MAIKSQKEIASELNLSESMLSLLLNGKRNLKWSGAVRISVILNCSPHIWINEGGTVKQRRSAIKNHK